VFKQTARGSSNPASGYRGTVQASCALLRFAGSACAWRPVPSGLGSQLRRLVFSIFLAPWSLGRSIQQMSIKPTPSRAARGSGWICPECGSLLKRSTPYYQNEHLGKEQFSAKAPKCSVLKDSGTFSTPRPRKKRRPGAVVSLFAMIADAAAHGPQAGPSPIPPYPEGGVARPRFKTY
jgi:hypothetical protein